MNTSTNYLQEERYSNIWTKINTNGYHEQVSTTKILVIFSIILSFFVITDHYFILKHFIQHNDYFTLRLFWITYVIHRGGVIFDLLL